MNINKEYIKTAIDEYERIEKALTETQGISFYAAYKAISKKFYNNTHNYDGELFDIELSRVLATIILKGNTAILDKYVMFDISEDLSGEWIDTSIDELKKAVN